MNKLTQEQQQLILDFYFRCGDLRDIEGGRDLIAASPEAAKLYAGLENTLTDLDHIKYESCPICYGTFFDAGEFRDLKENSVLERFLQMLQTLRTNL